MQKFEEVLFLFDLLLKTINGSLYALFFVLSDPIGMSSISCFKLTELVLYFVEGWAV